MRIEGYRNAKKAPFIGAFLFCVGVYFAFHVTSSRAETVTVRHVVDGDTVVLADDRTVRLLAINTPEKEFDNRPAQPYALEALLFLQETILDKQVRLVVGQQQKDKYGRTLAYLELIDGRDVQQLMLERGYGFVVAFPPDIDRLDRYLATERTARQSRLGVWGDKYWQPRNLSRQTKDLMTGFALIEGTIQDVSRSKKNILLMVGDKLTITIRRTAWKEFWDGEPELLHGRNIEARGWFSKHKQREGYYLRVRHPAMMQTR